MYITNARYFFLLVIVLFTCRLVCGQAMFQKDNYDHKQSSYVDTITLFGSFYKKSVYNPVRDSKRMLINTSVNFAMSVAKFGTLWVSPESFSCWDKEQIREAGWFKSWRDNVKAGPVKDEDGFCMNGIMHPWGGAIYYMSARGSGYRWWESFIYSGLLSTFMWEYGLEAFAEVPSWNDLIVTPVAGSILGEGFFILKRRIVENDIRILNSRILGRSVLILMDPVNEFTDVLGYKTKNKVEIKTALVPVNSTDSGKSQTNWGFSINVIF